MEEIKSKINTQFKILERSERDCAKILERKKDNEVQKHINYIEQRLDTIQDLKYEVQALMIGDGVEEEKVDEWVNITDEKVTRYQEVVDRLNMCLEDMREVKKEETRKRENEKQEEIFKRRMEEELKIEEMKLQMKKKGEEKDIIVNRNIQVKLPKLELTKFEGTPLDWFRFWNQFETQIDKVEISAITKFSYLKEFLVPKVRTLIDNLPFTSEGYARAKSILLAKFGKPSEVAAAHIQCITSLPLIPNSNTNRIHDFYEKLVIM